MAKKRTRKRVAPKGTAEVLREAWHAALDRVNAAEGEVEKQVRKLMKTNKLSARDAREFLGELGTRLEKQRRKATRELDARLKNLQARVKKERRVAARLIEEGVQQALASFNIPSRREVAELTVKVDELSRKIDSLRRRK